MRHCSLKYVQLIWIVFEMFDDYAGQLPCRGVVWKADHMTSDLRREQPVSETLHVAYAASYVELIYAAITFCKLYCGTTFFEQSIRASHVLRRCGSGDKKHQHGNSSFHISPPSGESNPTADPSSTPIGAIGQPRSRLNDSPLRPFPL